MRSAGRRQSAAVCWCPEHSSTATNPHPKIERGACSSTRPVFRSPRSPTTPRVGPPPDRRPCTPENAPCATGGSIDSTAKRSRDVMRRLRRGPSSDAAREARAPVDDCRRHSGCARGRAVGRCQPVDRPTGFVCPDYGPVQVRIHRQRARSLNTAAGRRRAAALLGVPRSAGHLPRQAARRLRLARLHRRARARAANRGVATAAARGRSGRTQLRRVPHGDRARKAGRAAARDCRESARFGSAWGWSIA